MRCTAVLVNHRCPLSCKHCSVGFSESYRGDDRDISPEEMRRLISTIDPEVYGIVAMAGGEPSLSPKTVRAGIEACKERGLLSYLVSAPVWGRSRETARRFLDKIPGLDLVILSYDDYHLEFLSFDHYRNATLEANASNTNVVFQICYAREDEKQRLIDSLESLRSRIMIVPSRTHSVGNAKDNDLGQVWVEVGDESDLGRIPRTCVVGNTLLDEELAVHGCCWSVMGKNSPIRHPSNGDSSSIRQAYKELEGNPVFQALHAHGFIDSLSAEGRRKAAAQVKGERFATECDLCMRLMKSESTEVWSHCRAAQPALSKA